MNSRKASQRISAQRFLVVVLLAVPALIWGNQDEKNTPPPPPGKQATQAKPPAQPAARPPATTGGPTTTQRPTTSTPPVQKKIQEPPPRVQQPPTPGRPGTKHVQLKNGETAEVSPRSNNRLEIRVRDAKGGEMTINHGLHGGRTIVSEHIDTGHAVRVVSYGRYGGYVQRAYFPPGGRTYYQRTYVVNGVAYTYVYRGYYYGGVRYYGYVPVYYYHPVYYGWAYNPWPAPVYYNWGWGGAPWYGYYGPYFAPYPAYPTASLWLTDYLLAANLQAAYQAQADANAANAAAAQANASAAQANATAAQAQANAAAYQAPASAPAAQPAAGGNGNATQLTPEVKQAIAEEIKAQLAAEQAAAPNPSAQPPASGASQVPPALDPAHSVFVVSDHLDVNAGGQECSLTPGDVITRISTKPDASQRVDALVTSSKKGDCSASSQVAVSVQDLQEMHNHFREQLDTGLKTLADNSGKNGLPKAPDTSTTSGEVAAPKPDADAADQLRAQQQQADQTEAQVQQVSQNEPYAPPVPWPTAPCSATIRGCEVLRSRRGDDGALVVWLQSGPFSLALR